MSLINISEIVAASSASTITLGYKTNVLNYANGSSIYDGTVSATTAINSALAAMPTGGTLYFPCYGAGKYALTGNIDLTLYPGIAIEFEPGADIKLNGYTITGNRTRLIAGIHQIFDMSVGGVFAGTFIFKYCFPEWFGAIGDGATNDSSAINYAILLCNVGSKNLAFSQAIYYISSAITLCDNLIIYGNNSKIMCSSYFDTNGYSNIYVNDLIIDSSINQNPIFRITLSSKNIKFEKCKFYNCAQAILLFTCEQIRVFSCYFNYVQYSIIQENGYTSSHVVIDSCICENSRADFVECNCESLNTSYDWIITNNQFLYDVHWPTAQTESRFVGITYVEGVTIANNYCYHCSGDAPIHLEGATGKVIITGNHLKDCRGTNGYIYILNNGKNTIITNNTFEHTVTTINMWVMDLTSSVFTNKIIFANNIIIGNASYTLSGINLRYNQNKSFIGNTFIKCGILFSVGSNYNIVIMCNTCTDCNYGIYDPTSASGGSANNFIVSSNFLDTNNNSVLVERNTSGTGTPSNWIIVGNYFGGNAIATDTESFLAVANTVSATGALTINFGDTRYTGSSNYFDWYNFKNGTGILNKATTVSDPAGGATVDTECRNAVTQIIDRLQLKQLIL